jgi:hypothetical protein
MSQQAVHNMGGNGKGRKTKEKEEEEEQQKEVRPPKIRQANIGALIEKCLLCGAQLTDAAEVPNIASEKFFLIQHAANSDNTGYETYMCQFCKKQITIVVSSTPLIIQPTFQMGPLFGGGQAGADPDQQGAQPST